MNVQRTVVSLNMEIVVVQTNSELCLHLKCGYSETCHKQRDLLPEPLHLSLILTKWMKKEKKLSFKGAEHVTSLFTCSFINLDAQTEPKTYQILNIHEKMCPWLVFHRLFQVFHFSNEFH